MLDLSNKTFSIFSLDKEIGGISAMIELSTLIMASEAKNINLFLLKGTNTFNLISNKFLKKKNIIIFELSIVDKIYFKFGILKKNIEHRILDSDAIFIHNAKLAASFKKINKIKPIILFFHTDKSKQIKMLKNVSRVFTVNNKTKELINNFYKDKKAYLLPNCINITNKKSYYKPKSRKLVVGAMGRFVKKKGFELLIQAFRENNNAELLIAGNGPLMKSYQKLTKESIRYLGKLTF